MQRMAGTSTMGESLKSSLKQIVKTPITYMRSPQYFYVAGTYVGTYVAKNGTDTLCLATKQSNEATAFYKFWLVFAANGGLSVFWKDPGLAKLFGKQGVVMTKASYAWWAARDCIHMLGACCNR
jgi:hypothetical protein